MRSFVPAIAILLTLGLPGAARADWGWTYWGMDAPQSVAESRGAARLVQGEMGQRVDGWDLRALGVTRRDGIEFKAEFFFDPDGKALHVVKLTPKLLDCPALLKILNKRYGPPSDQSIVLPSNNPIRITLLDWRDRARGDFVGYSENPTIGDLPAGCFVRYRPLSEADTPSS